MGDVTEALARGTLDGEPVATAARRGRANAAECTHRGGPPLPVPGRDVPRCPLGPKGRERERLVAYAVGPDGHRRPGHLGPEESNSWSELLEHTPGAWSLRRPARIAEHAGLAPRCAASCPRCAAILSTCNATAGQGPASPAQACGRRLPPSSGPPGSLSRRSAWPRSRRAGTRSSPRQSTCLSGASRPPPSSTRSPSPTGPDCAPRTASSACTPRSSVGSGAPAPSPTSQRAPPSCGCSKDYCGLERTSLPGSHASRTSPRQPNRSIEELPLTFTHNSGLDRQPPVPWDTSARPGRASAPLGRGSAPPGRT